MASRWTADDVPDQSGRIALVTGANSGIGLETAQVLAGAHAHVVLACRDPRRAESAAQAIRSAHPDASLEVLPLDLSSLASVRDAAKAFGDRHEKLDRLINNAGIMAIPRRTTADGFEMQLGTNHLGHFALTGLLLERLLATPGARVVTVSSLAHRQGRIRFDDLQGERSYSRWGAYGQSKLANLLFAYELDRRLKAAGADVLSLAAHPGWTITNLQDHSRLARFFNPFFGQPAPMGALPTLYAATAPDVRGGDYFGPGGFMEMRGHPKRVRSTSRSHDPEAARRLWEISEELTGVRYALA